MIIGCCSIVLFGLAGLPRDEGFVFGSIEHELVILLIDDLLLGALHICRLERVRCHHALILCLLLSEWVYSFSDFTIQIFLRCRFERHLASKHDKKKDSTGPHICCSAPIILLVHYLRWHVRWRPAENSKLVSWDTGESEVNELDLVGLWVVHYVFRLEVSVADVFIVHED